METVEEVNAWLANYSFRDWTLVCREPHLSRNRGCETVLRMIHADLVDVGTAPQKTTFDMEIPLQLPIATADAEHLLWSLIQFTSLHETAEWFRTTSGPVFDPHNPDVERTIYETPTIIWSESDA